MDQFCIMNARQLLKLFQKQAQQTVKLLLGFTTLYDGWGNYMSPSFHLIKNRKIPHNYLSVSYTLI